MSAAVRYLRITYRPVVEVQDYPKPRAERAVGYNKELVSETLFGVVKGSLLAHVRTIFICTWASRMKARKTCI
jgi:hypothetical protein